MSKVRDTKYKFVKVYWEDAWATNSEEQYRTMDNECLAIGMLMERTKKGIALVQNISSYSNRDIMFIPDKMINKVQVIK